MTTATAAAAAAAAAPPTPSRSIGPPHRLEARTSGSGAPVGFEMFTSLTRWAVVVGRILVSAVLLTIHLLWNLAKAVSNMAVRWTTRHPLLAAAALPTAFIVLYGLSVTQSPAATHAAWCLVSVGAVLLVPLLVSYLHATHPQLGQAALGANGNSDIAYWAFQHVAEDPKHLGANGRSHAAGFAPHKRAQPPQPQPSLQPQQLPQLPQPLRIPDVIPHPKGDPPMAQTDLTALAFANSADAQEIVLNSVAIGFVFELDDFLYLCARNLPRAPRELPQSP